MGIYLTLSDHGEKKIPIREVALSRLHYAAHAIRFFYSGRIFDPHEIVVWTGRPSEALGGEQVYRVEVKDFEADIKELITTMADPKQYALEQLLSTIIQINGTWDFNNYLMNGFFSVNNNASWRSVYHDLEIDAYSRGEIGDLTDAIWLDEDSQGIVARLVDAMDIAKIGQKVRPREIFFSVGVPAKGEVSNLRALHCSERRYLIDFMYSALSEGQTEDIHDKLGPLNKGFFISSIAKEKVVNERLEIALKETVISEKFGNSVTYFAKDKESFAKLYEKLYDSVFKPAFKNLPRAMEVRAKIVNGLTKTEQTHF